MVGRRTFAGSASGSWVPLIVSTKDVAIGQLLGISGRLVNRHIPGMYGVTADPRPGKIHDSTMSTSDHDYHPFDCAQGGRRRTPRNDKGTQSPPRSLVETHVVEVFGFASSESIS